MTDDGTPKPVDSYAPTPTTQAAPDELENIVVPHAFGPYTLKDVLQPETIAAIEALIHTRESQLLDRVMAEKVTIRTHDGGSMYIEAVPIEVIKKLKESLHE